LPCLARHVLRTLEVPISSADAERAFSSYNTLLYHVQVECHWRIKPFVCWTQLHRMVTLVVDLQAMIIKNDILRHSYWRNDFGLLKNRF